MQRTFVSNASHELRTPLTIIIGEIEVLLSRSRTEMEYRTAVEAIMHEAEQLNMLVNTLLSFARAGDKGKDQLVEPIRLDELLIEIVEEARRKHPVSDMRLEVNELPHDPDKMSIPGSYPLLLSAISNIIDNAIKFSKGKPVICRFSVPEEKVIIDIIDQGIGISEKDLKNLFQPFFRASNARAFHGHGLGLALSRRIVRLHGGDIYVSSKEDIGTEFRLEFNIV
jgi:signal transduction histidine kinase